MKKLLLFLCFSSAIVLKAQQIKVNLSGPVDIKHDLTSFHKYGNYYYADKINRGNAQLGFSANLKKAKNGVELTQYDEQFKEVKRLSLDNDKKDFGPFFPVVHFSGNLIYVLYYKYEEDDKVKVYVSKINPADLKVITNKVVMEFDQNNMAVLGLIKVGYYTNTLFKESPDGKNIWVIHATPSHIFSTVVDADLNAIQKVESTPVKLDKLVVTDAFIGNDGNKVLAYSFLDPENDEYNTRGLFFQAANAKGAIQRVKLPNAMKPGALTLKPSKDGKKVFVGGEYFAEYKSGGQGVFLGEVNITGQSVSAPKNFPYTEELKQRVLDLDFASRRKGEIVFEDHDLNYKIDELENGTLVLSADMHTSSYSTHASADFTGPVVHVFIQPAGKSTMTLIPKKQMTSPFTSYFTYVSGNKLISIYGDLPKFQDKDIKDKQIGLVRTVSGMVPVANVYDADGNLLSKKKLFDSEKEIKGNVMISEHTKVGDSRFMLPVGEEKTGMNKYYQAVYQICYLDIL